MTDGRFEITLTGEELEQCGVGIDQWRDGTWCVWVGDDVLDGRLPNERAALLAGLHHLVDPVYHLKGQLIGEAISNPFHRKEEEE